MIITVFVISLLFPLACGMPVAFALIVSSVAMMAYMDLFSVDIIAQNMIGGSDNFILMAVPFFLLAGELMNAGGLSRRIVDLGFAFVGHFNGGLGYVAIFAAMILASLSGSAVADTAAICAMLMPMMRKAGYDPGRSAGLIAAGGIIAPVIPPSIGLIIFGVVANVSITKLFLAGIVPGILMGASLVVTWWLINRGGDRAPVRPRATAKELMEAVRSGTWAILMPVIIIGGLRGGVFTPTEAAVIAVAYSAFVGAVIYRELGFASCYAALVRAAKASAAVMLIIAAASVSAWLITITDIQTAVASLLQPFIEYPKLTMLLMMLLVVVIGTALDFTPTILIMTPVLMPICAMANIDPIYFGVLFVMNNAIGLITPPVGSVLNAAAGASGLTLDNVTKGVWPFLVAELVVLGILVLFPELVMWPARLLF